MTMQQDGNLVVYNEQNKPIWAAMTFGQNHRAIFQPDGNLVIHNGDDRPIWAREDPRLRRRPDGAAPRRQGGHRAQRPGGLVDLIRSDPPITRIRGAVLLTRAQWDTGPADSLTGTT